MLLASKRHTCFQNFKSLRQQNTYLHQSADGSELLRVEGERRPLTQPLVEEAQLSLVPVEDKVGNDLGDKV